jgi:flagellar biosynthesis chaperone FliJ
VNKTRRAALSKVIDRVEALKTKWEELVAEASEAHEELETLKDEEEEYKDNMHENLHGGEKYQDAEAAISEMEEALSALSELADADEPVDFDSIVSSIDNSRGQ